ncbi:MAG: flagellar biosynthesis anti-sigma factor FlgM [Brevinematales bacterium]|nr:flagellar biosynthesis anti-sigma factor FlgM [Brevinematales bacterium]
MYIRGVGGPEPIKPNKIVGNKGESSINANNQINKDEVSISDDARQILQRKQAEEVALSSIKNTPDIRPEAVERGKKFIESGEYKSDKAIEKVSNKIGEEILASIIVKNENSSV